MTFLQAIILGMVEGVSEFLPISSTGHLIVAGHLLGIPQTDFLKSFEIIIQLGAISAVALLYIKVLLSNMRLWRTLIISFIPTGVIGLLFYSLVKKYLLGNVTIVLWSLFIGGIVLIVYEMIMKRSAATPKRDQMELSITQALGVGLIQSVSLVPGVSRSAATIIGAGVMGMSRRAAVEFSFLLAVPTILAASSFDIIKNASLFSAENIPLLAAGFVSAFIVASVSIVFFLNFVQRRTFIPFGIYRILAAIVFACIIFSPAI